MSDDFLRLFAFRTGLPCGYLLFFLFGVFCCVVAVVVLVVGIVWRKVVLVALPSLFLLLAATFVVGNIAYERSLDINASLPNAELIGRWQTPQSTLVLRRDGSYQLRAGDDLSKVFATSASVGKWQPEGFGVRLTDSSGRALPRLRTITFRGKPHLILEFDDPDAWDGDLGFSKAPGA